MAPYTLASQLLEPGEIGLFIFTMGEQLELRADGSASTGDWIINPARHVDWVCIYRRDRHDASLNELFKGRPAGIEPSPRDAAKHVIHVSDVILMGNTDVRWPDFATTGRGSIRYVAAPRSKASARQRRASRP